MGFNLENVPGDGWGLYGYTTPPGATSAGFSIGASITGNIAFGSGAWTGPFNNGEVSGLSVAGSDFETPISEVAKTGEGYFGVSLGWSPTPIPGFGYTPTQYWRIL